MYDKNENNSTIPRHNMHRVVPDDCTVDTSIRFKELRLCLIISWLPMLLTMSCFSVFCDFYIVKIDRLMIVRNLTNTTIKTRYSINHDYVYADYQQLIVSTDNDTGSVEIPADQYAKWACTYRDSSQCIQQFVVYTDDTRFIDTLFITTGDSYDTILCPIDTTFFKYETHSGVNTWKADSGTVVYDTLDLVAWDDSLVYEFR